MRRPFPLYVLALLLPAIAFLVFWQPVPVHSQSLAPAVEGQQFRIIVGLKDTGAKPWKGKIAVFGGEILDLAGWRASPADKASASGDFTFNTKIGLLENQLRPGSEYGQTGGPTDGNFQHLIPQGLLLKLRGNTAAHVEFQSASGTFAFDTSQISYGAVVPMLDGNASIERLPIEQKLSTEGPSDDQPAIAIAPDGKRWVAWLSYLDKSDGLMVSDGSKVYNVGDRGDLHSPAIAADSKGAIQVVWPRNQNGGFQLLGSTFRNGAWSSAQALTTKGSSNFWPQLAADGSGHMALVWQGFRNNQSVILARLWDGRSWSEEQQASEGEGNCWAPAVSYGGGHLWIAWDSYATGAYQIYAREWNKPVTRITKGDRFSVRASVVVSASGQPVIAWEESDSLWGKDFAWQVDRRGTTEYKNRRIRVAYLDAGEWKEHPAAVVQAVPAAIRRFIQQPQLAIDPTGRLYMALRIRTSVRNARNDYFAGGGRWESFVTHLDGDAWSPIVPMPASVGRNGMRSAIALDRGQLYSVWPTDARRWPGGVEGDLDVYAATMGVTGNPAHLAGGKPITANAPAPNPNPAEVEDLNRVRGYRYALNGKQYRVLRGDFHRHTELSGDGAGDGRLEDNYRYTLDAASMDIGYVSDHQMGGNVEYNWWITQKSNDLFYMPQRFVPMYGYERRVPYPNGHRNIIWTERGQPVLKISPSENDGQTNTGSVLYPYLRQTKGIATSHTSATDQGTDWRDNDPALEPVVEIYQGYDNNYEEPNAPRTWKEGKSSSHGKQQPAGFIWNAWAKGYKLGVQSSSDHISTHTSYACVIAENLTREGSWLWMEFRQPIGEIDSSLMDALRKRHTYAATDNIILDFEIPNTSNGTALMGDIVSSSAPPKLSVKITGTAPIRQIDIVKNNKYIHQLTPGQKEVRFEYVDKAIASGESYYYVRVEQTDGQMAWSSPIWVTYK
jgi:hypothetical protein